MLIDVIIQIDYIELAREKVDYRGISKEKMHS